MTRRVQTGMGARARLVRGALALVEAVSSTYGPLGGLVALDRLQGLLHTKDGASVAMEIVLPDPVENMGARLLREACVSTNEVAGDGTTTTAILAGALLRESHLRVASGFNPVELVRGMERAADVAFDVIAEMASDVTEQGHLYQVALVASNGDEEIAHHMAEAAMSVGRDGVILVEDSRRVGLSLEFKDGMELDRGWEPTSGELFVNDPERMVIHSESCLVAVCLSPLSSARDVVSMMEEASTFRPSDDAPLDPLLIIAPYIEGEALQTLYLNNPGGVKSKLRSIHPRPTYFALASPGTRHRWSDHLGDIAALADATLVDPAAGMDHRQFRREWFGGLREVSISRKRSVLMAYESAEGSITQRVRVLRAMEAMEASEHERDVLRERRARLSGSVCVFRVGSEGATEASLKERRARVEDALAAVRGALRGGVVPGGGTTFLEASVELRSDVCFGSDGEREGWRLMASALESPLRALVRRSDVPAGVVIERVSRAQPWEGWDVVEGCVRDLAQEPAILDPAPVLAESLRSAVSVVKTILMADVAVWRAR